MELTDGPLGFYGAQSRLLCRWVAEEPHAPHAEAVFGGVPCIMGLNAQDKHTLRLVFLFTSQCQSPQSGARVWQHRAMTLDVLLLRGHRILAICNLKQLLSSVLVTNFGRANCSLTKTDVVLSTSNIRYAD